MKTNSGFLITAALCLLFFFAIFLTVSKAAPTSGKPDQELILKTYGKLGLYFIENKGQLDSKVRFYVKTAGQTLYFTDEGIVFDLFRKTTAGEKKYKKGIEQRAKDHQATEQTGRLVFTLGFDNPGGKIVPEGLNRQDARINSFVGKDKSRWRKGIPAYKAVIYKGVYQKIDLKIYGTGTNLEYEFIVHPGGNPKDIMLTYNGIEGLTTNGDGDLLIETAFGEPRETKPYIYQEINGKRMVAGSFVIKSQAGHPQTSEYSYGFQVSSYDPAYPLSSTPPSSILPI